MKILANIYCTVFLLILFPVNHAFSQSTLVDGKESPPTAEDVLPAILNVLQKDAKIIAKQEGGSDVVGRGLKREQMFKLLNVTRSNPFLEKECEDQAMSFGAHTLYKTGKYESIETASQTAEDHFQELAHHVSENGISYADYIMHAGTCEHMCGPVVTSMVNCHIGSVSSNPHGIVLFDFNNDEVKEVYKNGLIKDVAAKLNENPNAKVLLVGRASQIGSLAYNYKLSKRRSSNVKQLLTAAGAPSARVADIAFGWEPPQINSLIASEYGYNGLFQDIGEYQMNQSVILVLYDYSSDLSSAEGK